MCPGPPTAALTLPSRQHKVVLSGLKTLEAATAGTTLTGAMESVRVILKAVNEGNPALALRTTNAELAKNPTSDVYLSLKVLVASKMNDRALAVETAKQAVKVCSKKTMEMFLIPVLVAYNEPELLATAFVRTNRQDPQDPQITEGWVEVMLLLGNLSAAQKALMAQQKHSKKPRLTCFQACLVMALDAPNPVFPMLADRMLEKYLPVKSAQECYVAALVQKMTSQDKLVAYLQSPANREYIAASLDLQQLLLKGLQETEQWAELFEYAKSQLEQIDSYNYWEALNKAAVELHKTGEAVEFNAKFKGNNASLAKVNLAARLQHRETNGHDNGLNSAVAEYWDAMSSKPSTFDYIKPYITVQMVDLLAEKSDLGSQINLAKLKAFVGHPTALSNPELFSLYEKHKSEIPKVSTDYFIGTDALLLAATRVLSEQQFADFSREKAAAILEYAVANDPHQFYARVLLVQIYRSLGAYDLAVKHFDSLSIRNLQLETLGHLLATRAGSSSPKLTARVFDKLLLARERVPNMGTYAMGALNDSAFTQFHGVFELGERLRFSLGYALLALEKVKSSRLSRGTVQLTDVAQLPEPESSLRDSRDFKTAFDIYPQGVAAVSTVGPFQQAEFVNIEKRKELACLAALKSAAKAPAIDLSFADAAADSLQLTPIERWNARAVADAIAGSKPLGPPAETSRYPADWAVSHWGYTVLETVKVLKDLRRPASPEWARMVRRMCSNQTASLDEYETAAAKAVSSEVPFESSQLVVGTIAKSTALVLKTLADAASP